MEAKWERILALVKEVDARYDEDIQLSTINWVIDMELYKMLSDDINRYYRIKMDEILGNIPKALLTALSVWETPM